MDLFNKDDRSALEAKEKAQFIAFAPIVFQAVRVLRESGILQFVESAGNKGCTIQEIATHHQLPLYGVRVLMEAGLGIGAFYGDGKNFKLAKTGFFLLNDPLTQINMNFVHDVCYKGMFSLDESISKGKPEGLKEFGNWKTIYEALSQLPKEIQKSWFDFDHYYSDQAFPDVLPLVLKYKPKRLLDIGGNTGKWALKCVAHDPEIEVTIMDLPGQLDMAREQISKAGFDKRVRYHACDLLDPANHFPRGFDAVWMSQFLDCFSGEEIVSILTRCITALEPGGSVFILEPFWDFQRFKASAFSLQMTSLYFTAMANGNSQMYHSADFFGFLDQAGLEVAEKWEVGVSHTLLRCNPKINKI